MARQLSKHYNYKDVPSIHQLEVLKSLIETQRIKNRQDIETIQIAEFQKEITTKQARVKLLVLQRIQYDLYVALGRVIENIRGRKNITSKKLITNSTVLIDAQNFSDTCSSPCYFEDIFKTSTFKKTRKRKCHTKK